MTQFGKKRYKTVGLGGTFDHFHKGHQHFLTYASELGFSLLVGVTTEPLTLGKPLQASLQSYQTRSRAVRNFCMQLNIPCTVIPLDNPYGPAIEKDTAIRALCVTTETRQGAVDINTVREAATLRPLPVFVSKMILDDNGEEIHSARIRGGEINRDGFIYKNLFIKDIVLSETQRRKLRNPLGEVLTNLSSNSLTTAESRDVFLVGDITLQFFKDNNLSYELAIFDGHTKQKPITHQLDEVDAIAVKNTAGMISKVAAQKVVDLVTLNNQSEKKHIRVEGEEDLLTAVVIAVAPLGSLVYYGQPNQGMVETVVTESIKEKIRSILQS